VPARAVRAPPPSPPPGTICGSSRNYRSGYRQQYVGYPQTVLHVGVQQFTNQVFGPYAQEGRELDYPL
jgi:hypothetical protein